MPGATFRLGGWRPDARSNAVPLSDQLSRGGGGLARHDEARQGRVVEQDETADIRLGRVYRPPCGGGPARLLLVLCHGVGADGRWMMSRFTAAWASAVPTAAFLAPHAPFPYRMRRARWRPFEHLFGREWFSLIDRSPAAEEAGVRVAARVLDRFIDSELQQFGLPPDALVLMGFSQGAITALFAGLRRPVPPRAILGFSGGLPAPSRLAAEIRNRAPVLLVHGEADRVVPTARSREAERTLRALDVPVQLVTLPATGHVVTRAGLTVGGDFLRRVLA